MQKPDLTTFFWNTFHIHLMCFLSHQFSTPRQTVMTVFCSKPNQKSFAIKLEITCDQAWNHLRSSLKSLAISDRKQLRARKIIKISTLSENWIMRSVNTYVIYQTVYLEFLYQVCGSRNNCFAAITWWFQPFEKLCDHDHFCEKISIAALSRFQVASFVYEANRWCIQCCSAR